MEDFAAARPGGLISAIVYTKPKAANFLPFIGRERVSVPPRVMDGAVATGCDEDTITS